MIQLKNLSIRNRLHLGASIVLLAFFCVTGLAVQGIYSQHLCDSHFARLQSAVYLLIAMTELNPQGQLELPKQLAEQGIGLAVVADIVGAYGGKVEIARSPSGGAAVLLQF
ncbi:hypothetical protein [Deefgea sp. CFH1-16]|uniref:hypothetical protein n=1 Tax=Deefgea sp. CFH1-16 TaxID=2675457 RepID=UPI0015F7453A|nr:hypothetical protein [Deefgea sp. CFH1-16]MBM5573769.1 hypothetical protein [Deefgea sp. CFH1-16]